MTNTKTPAQLAASAANLARRAERMKAERAERMAELTARMDAAKAETPKAAPVARWW